MSKDLRSFLKIVREAGPEQYAEVKNPLSLDLEIGIIQHKLAAKGRYPAIYCPEIKESKIPLVTNLFGSLDMYALEFDLDPKKIDKAEVLKEYTKRMDNRISPDMVAASEAPVKEVILKDKDADLDLLPIPKHAEGNSGKYMTMNPFICKDPETAIHNAGIYRHEVRGKQELAAQIHPSNHGAVISRKYLKRGEQMECAIFSGHHPAAIFGACQAGPLEMDEYEVMGGLMGEPLRLTQAETVDLLIPADAEIVVEGILDPNDWITDGPFSEFLGYYGEEMPAYRMKVKCITMRKDAVYLDLDGSHREHPMSMMLPLEATITQVVEKVVSNLKAVHFPPSGNCSHHCYISIKKEVQGEAKRAALAAIAMVPFIKHVVVVDDDVDIYRDEEVLWAISTRVRGDMDIDIIPAVTGNRMDPAGPYDEARQRRLGGGGFMTTKVIIDATKPVDLPFATRITPNKELWDKMDLKEYLK